MKRIVSLLLLSVIGIVAVAGLGSCGIVKKIQTKIEESKTVYIEGEIVYVQTYAKSGVHDVYVLPDDPSSVNKSKLLVVLEVTAGTNTESAFSTNIDDMPELAVGNRIKATYQNLERLTHYAIDLVPYTSELKTDKELTFYEVRKIDSFDMNKLQVGSANTRNGTVVYVEQMKFDDQDVFVVYIDGIDSMATAFFAIPEEMKNLGNGMYEKLLTGDTGYRVSVLYSPTEAVDGIAIRYICRMEIVE